MKRHSPFRFGCRIGIGTAAWLCLFGCAVGPDYHAPKTAMPGAFLNGPTQAEPFEEEALATWWSGFGDPTLNALVELAIRQNNDLRMATANLKEARALRRLATFDFVPTVQANAGYDNRLLSQAVAPPGATRSEREGELYDAGFDAAWELDLFGRVRRSVEVAKAGLEATEASRLDVLVSVTAEVARNYFELRGFQNQLAVARTNASVQGQTLALTESLLNGGRGTEFDVSRSRSLFSLTRSTIPPLEASIRKTLYRLAVLTGHQPGTMSMDLAEPAPLPIGTPTLAVNNPESLLRRRPDIRVAERSLAAATAGIGVLTADLFPRVSGPSRGQPNPDGHRLGGCV